MEEKIQKNYFKNPWLLLGILTLLYLIAGFSALSSMGGSTFALALSSVLNLVIIIFAVFSIVNSIIQIYKLKKTVSIGFIILLIASLGISFLFFSTYYGNIKETKQIQKRYDKRQEQYYLFLKNITSEFQQLQKIKDVVFDYKDKSGSYVAVIRLESGRILFPADIYWSKEAYPKGFAGLDIVAQRNFFKELSKKIEGHTVKISLAVEQNVFDYNYYTDGLDLSIPIPAHIYLDEKLIDYTSFK